MKKPKKHHDAKYANISSHFKFIEESAFKMSIKCAFKEILFIL